MRYDHALGGPCLVAVAQAQDFCTGQISYNRRGGKFVFIPLHHPKYSLQWPQIVVDVNLASTAQPLEGVLHAALSHSTVLHRT